MGPFGPTDNKSHVKMYKKYHLSYITSLKGEGSKSVSNWKVGSGSVSKQKAGSVSKWKAGSGTVSKGSGSATPVYTANCDILPTEGKLPFRLFSLFYFINLLYCNLGIQIFYIEIVPVLFTESLFLSFFIVFLVGTEYFW